MPQANGTSTVNGLRHVNCCSHAMYSIREQPLGSTKHVRIVGIGAGVSGINMIRTLRLNLTDYDLVIYEKNSDVGGTWLENRYPGCRCDIPSHNYQFSWRPNKEWPNFFSSAEEIEAYLCQVCREDDLIDSIRLQHQVVEARWDESAGLWRLKIRDLQSGQEFHDEANFLINGSGILNNWKFPDAEGLHDFKGDLVHTASWPKDFDYSGKTVAVIGNGASGIQLLPAIQPGVRQLYHVVRTSTWIVPPWRQTQALMGGSQIMTEIGLDAKENFTAEQIKQFRGDQEFYRRFVKAVEKDTSGNFHVMIKDGPIQAFAQAKVREFMTAALGGDEELCRDLIPDFPIGTRRMTPAPGYLEALRQDNVTVVKGSIKRVVADGIELETGQILRVDAIICATGFDLSFRPRFPLIGRDGDLRDVWRDEVPKAYMSCAVAGMPNYFTFLGPNAPVGHGSILTLSEHIAKYIAQAIKKWQAEGIKAMVPSHAAVDDYYEHIQAFMPRTTWASSGRSWFKGGKEDGPVIALHPGSRAHFFHMLEKFRGEDFEYVYDSPTQNRFGYLGNGFSTRELDPSFDPSWYLEE